MDAHIINDRKKLIRNDYTAVANLVRESLVYAMESIHGMWWPTKPTTLATTQFHFVKMFW